MCRKVPTMTRVADGTWGQLPRLRTRCVGSCRLGIVPSSLKRWEGDNGHWRQSSPVSTFDLLALAPRGYRSTQLWFTHLWVVIHLVEVQGALIRLSPQLLFWICKSRWLPNLYCVFGKTVLNGIDIVNVFQRICILMIYLQCKMLMALSSAIYIVGVVSALLYGYRI